MESSNILLLIFDFFKDIWIQLSDIFCTYSLAQLRNNMLKALIILIIGWFIAKIIQVSVKFILRITKFDSFCDKIGFSTLLETGGLHNIPSISIGNLIYWIIMFTVLLLCADIVETRYMIFPKIESLISYILRTISAVIIIIIGISIGYFISRLIRSAIINIGAHKNIAIAIEKSIFITILVASVFQSLGLLGLDKRIVIAIIDHAFKYAFLAIAIAVGIGGRYIAGDIVASIKLKKAFPKGTEIKFDNTKGIIKETKLLYSLIYTDNGILNVPNSVLAKKTINMDI